jgi:acyl-CoA thioester hydrolase
MTPEPAAENRHCFRVRYSETDQMGTFYNARALEWFEVGRTELLRQLGIPYAQMEARGVFLPLVEAHLSFQGRARYDDELEMSTRVRLDGRARLRFDVAICRRDDGAAVTAGHTIHAVTNPAGRPIRPPAWLLDVLGPGREPTEP